MIDEAEQQLAQVGEKIKHQVYEKFELTFTQIQIFMITLKFKQRQEDLKSQERMKVEYESQIRVLRENLSKMQDVQNLLNMYQIYDFN